MPIDYSKWDNMTFSDSDEETERAEDPRDKAAIAKRRQRLATSRNGQGQGSSGGSDGSTPASAPAMAMTADVAAAAPPTSKVFTLATPNINIAKAQAPPTAKVQAEAFAQRLQTNESFRKCRKVMMKFQSDSCAADADADADGSTNNSGGVLWLRNIINSGHAYEKRQFKKLNTGSHELLLKTLQECLEKTREVKRLELACPIKELYMVYSKQGSDGDDGINGIITKTTEGQWPELAKEHSASIADPNILFGFFLTYPQKDSATVIITTFEFRI